MRARPNEYESLFQEINTALDYSLHTDNITIGLSATDLIGIASLANRSRRNDILHIIRDVAVEHQAAGTTTNEEQLYSAVGKVIGCLLYVNRDASIEEIPSVDENDFKLYLGHMPPQPRR